jgi:hypothetical protein
VGFFGFFWVGFLMPTLLLIAFSNFEKRIGDITMDMSSASDPIEINLGRKEI